MPLTKPSRWWQWVPGASVHLRPAGGASAKTGITRSSMCRGTMRSRMPPGRGTTADRGREWEYAARGGLAGKRYAWGDDNRAGSRANHWQGDSRRRTWAMATRARRRSAFPPNGYGLYDMAGNVWEWCADWYRRTTTPACARQRVCENPTGPEHELGPRRADDAKRVSAAARSCATKLIAPDIASARG